MPFQPLLHRLLAIAGGVVGLVVAGFCMWIQQTPAQESRPPTPVLVRAAPPPTAEREDPLALSFAALQRAFVPETADLHSERRLAEVAQGLASHDGLVEVTWTEETLLLAESRVQHLQQLLEFWDIHEDRLVLWSQAGEPGVTVRRIAAPLAPDTLVAPW